jgi:hypothetical protein
MIMEKLLMTQEEFKEFDKKIQTKIKAYDASAAIESAFSPMTIPVSGAESVRAYWAVSGKITQGVYSFALFLRDGNIWELESKLPTWTTSGNQKQIAKVLRDFYTALPKAFFCTGSAVPTDVMYDGRLQSRVNEATDKATTKVETA